MTMLMFFSMSKVYSSWEYGAWQREKQYHFSKQNMKQYLGVNIKQAHYCHPYYCQSFLYSLRTIFNYHETTKKSERKTCAYVAQKEFYLQIDIIKKIHHHLNKSILWLERSRNRKLISDKCHLFPLIGVNNVARYKISLETISYELQSFPFKQRRRF